MHETRFLHKTVCKIMSIGKKLKTSHWFSEIRDAQLVFAVKYVFEIRRQGFLVTHLNITNKDLF